MRQIPKEKHSTKYLTSTLQTVKVIKKQRKSEKLSQPRGAEPKET